LTGVAGLPGAGLSGSGDYTLSSGLLFSYPGVQLSSKSISLSESGPSTAYTLHLLTQPTADVTITISPDTQLTASLTTLTFTPGSWSIDQTVSISAKDDDILQGAHDAMIMHTAVSADPNYDNISIDSVTAHITDNDSAGIVISESGGFTAFTEGGSDSYQIVLTSQPSTSVAVSVYAPSSVTFNPSDLIFDTTNWDIPQEITISAADDSISQGSRDAAVSHKVTSSDTLYDNLTVPDVIVHILDNDTPGVNIVQSGITEVTEGAAADSYQINLSTQPSDDVTVSMQVYDSGTIYLSKSALTFTPANWSDFQTIEVSAADDNAAQGNRTTTIGHSVSSSDPGYNGISVSDVNVTIYDNDQAGLIITESNGSTTVTEGGSGDSYTLALSTKPSSDVRIDISSGSQIDITPASLIFTPANWSDFQTIEVSAADDNAVQGNRTTAISHSVSSSDPGYNGIAVSDVNVTIYDNDQAGLIITESNGSTTVTEGGSGDSYTLALSTKPASDVRIDINSGSQVVITPASLTFTPANWDQTQSVNVSAVDDNQAEGSHNVLISHAVNSSDPVYNVLAPVTLQVTIIDNDQSHSGNEDREQHNDNTSTPQPIAAGNGWAEVEPGRDGSISLDGDVSLNIPAGALSGNSKVIIRISRTDINQAAPAGYRILGQTYRITVNGAEHYKFAYPVKLSFLLDNMQGSENTGIYYFDDERNEWVGLGGEISNGTISTTVDHFTLFSVIQKENRPSFIDISKHWAKAAIEKMAALGATEGYPDGSFKPDRTITRAEFVTALVKALNLKASNSKVYADTTGHWAREFISIAEGCGLITGYNDGTFRPDEPVTREQMALIAVKAAGMNNTTDSISFTDDLKISAWARSGVLSAINSGIMKGYPDNTFRPRDKATRAEAMYIIIKLVK